MIDPNTITTIQVNQLIEDIFGLNDNIPHEVNGVLKRGKISDFATFLGGVIGSSSALAFLPINVVDGQTLPNTTTNEWFLAGKGTYHQTGGYSDIVCTKDVNAIVGNSLFWSLGVEVDIPPPKAMISQSITQGVVNYSPSEDAVYSFGLTKISSIASKRFAGLGQTYTLPTGAIGVTAYIDGYIQYLEDPLFTADLNTFTQTGNDVTFKTTIETGSQILIQYYL